MVPTKHIEDDQAIISRPKVSLYAMNGGEGPRSYAQNSSYQGGVVNVAKPIIEEEIAIKLDVSSPSNAYCIADFGCSTGHNSFPAVQLMLQALKKKQLHDHENPKQNTGFYVFFNDVVSNDFNTLFGSLPHERDYHAIAVPGDFHGRLFPESSIHMAYSSWSLQWLTEVPEDVNDSSSPAWNKGHILYPKENKAVCDAYSDQYAKDIESFLGARAVEVVSGGLMALLIPGVPEFWNPETEYTIPCDINLLGSCLVDMANEGRFSQRKVDTFNLPYYFTTPTQLKAILDNNHSFTIERMEILNNPGMHTLPNINARAAFYRAVHERLLADHFGSDIVHELFDRYTEKLAGLPVFLNPSNDRSIVILAVLKRRTD